LAAVIILPMVLDSEPVPVAEDIPIRMPEANTPYQPQVSPPVVADAGNISGTTPEGTAQSDPAATVPAPPDLSSQPSEPPAVTPPPEPKPDAKPETPKPETAAPKPTPAPPKQPAQ